MRHPSSPEADEVRARLTRDLSASYEMVARRDVGRGGGDRDRRSLSGRTAARNRCSSPPSRRRRRPRQAHGSSASTRRARFRRRRRSISTSRSRRRCRRTDDGRHRDARRVSRSAARRIGGRRIERRWRASIDAVPVGEPPYVVQVRLKPDSARRHAGHTGPSERPAQPASAETVADVVVDRPSRTDPRGVLRSAALVGDDLPAARARSGRALSGRRAQLHVARHLRADRRRGPARRSTSRWLRGGDRRRPRSPFRLPMPPHSSATCASAAAPSSLSPINASRPDRRAICCLHPDLVGTPARTAREADDDVGRGVAPGV